MAPASVVPLGLAGFILPLITNMILTTLIVICIWYLSPHKVQDMRSTQFMVGTSRAVIEIVIESGILYMAVQFVFVVLFSIRHPVQGIIGVMAMQIYMYYSITLKGRPSFQIRYPPKIHTGHCTDTDSRLCCPWLVLLEYAVQTETQRN